MLITLPNFIYCCVESYKPNLRYCPLTHKIGNLKKDCRSSVRRSLKIPACLANSQMNEPTSRCGNATDIPPKNASPNDESLLDMTTEPDKRGHR